MGIQTPVFDTREFTPVHAAMMVMVTMAQAVTEQSPNSG